jgi:hypothetical protein
MQKRILTRKLKSGKENEAVDHGEFVLIHVRKIPARLEKSKIRLYPLRFLDGGASLPTISASHSCARSPCMHFGTEFHILVRSKS